jgi:glycosyltransferase involved in cell wall biosynthesis
MQLKSYSIIVPTYNSESSIKLCLNRIIQEAKNLKYEIIIVDDASSDRTEKIISNFKKKIRFIKLKKNKGVGYVRNYGAKIALYKTLIFIDSDIIVSRKSIKNLIKNLYKNKNIGSVGALPKVANLTKKNWSSNFVCLKSCYGNDFLNNVFSSNIQSEFCAINKNFLKKIGGWKFYDSAGGEEYELGYQINLFKKKNLLIHNAKYKTYYANLYLRFKKIISRTDKYISILLKKKKFDTQGSFSTSSQAFSSVLTLIIFSLILLNFFYYHKINNLLLTIGIIIQFIIEYKFLIFAKKYFGLKMLIFSLFGIQIINIGIILGIFKFCIKKIIKFALIK